ncbi:MAG TPA: hypothetical protein PKL15_03380 [Saprospiraceae bacterium]|nr:hypothetical protein [Saprospiraceae bacterium]HNL40410.1 hypothetical protein [Saprospiraceae bacterium]HNM24440.1 hypothetical protein [Saprospiraceae bacterium]
MKTTLWLFVSFGVLLMLQFFPVEKTPPPTVPELDVQQLMPRLIRSRLR